MKKVEIKWVEFTNGNGTIITYNNGDRLTYICFDDSDELYWHLAFSNDYHITNLDDVFIYDDYQENYDYYENETYTGMYVFNLDNKQYFI